MGLRKGKGTDYEGGLRVPAIAYWKGKISPRVYTDVISTLDWFPTITQITGVQAPVDRKLDGYDLTDVLLNNGQRISNTYAYFRNNRQITGLRVGDWKITLPEDQINGNFWRASTAAHDTLLFNLKEDPAETTNFFKKYPEKAAEMKTALEQYKATFGEVLPELVTWGNHQLRELQEQRQQVIDEAIKRGIQSKANQVDGFIEAQ